VTLSFKKWLEDAGPVDGISTNAEYQGLNRLNSKHMSGRKKVKKLPGSREIGDPVDPEDKGPDADELFGKKMKKKMKKDSK